MQKIIILNIFPYFVTHHSDLIIVHPPTLYLFLVPLFFLAPPLLKVLAHFVSLSKQ